MTTDPGRIDPTSATGPTDGASAGTPGRASEGGGPTFTDEPGPGPDGPPGVRDQIAAVIAAARRLLTAHIELGRAELGLIMAEVGRVAALAGLAFAMVFLAALLLPIGLLLFLGEWIYGSIGWGVLLGTILLGDVAVMAGLTAAGVSGRRLGWSFGLAVALGIVVGVVLGLDLTNRAWTTAGDNLMPGVDAGFRPLAIAVLSLGVIGGVLGLIAALRSRASGGAGFFGGAALGIVLGAVTAIAVGPRVGAAFGTLSALIAWPVFAGLAVARSGIDGDAIKARFYPDTTIETTKETIEWLRQRTPLGRKS